MEMLIVPGIVLLIALVWFIGTYNGLVRLRNHIRESWSGIDTELKRRYELIPNLVNTVKGYTQHEKDVLESVVEARTRAVASTGSPQTQAQDENALVGALQSLLAVVENYPDLKANENYLHLQEELVNTEDRIQAARRFYNANVRDYNNRTEVFPSNIVAGMFGFAPAEFFEIESACQRSVPNVAV
ncbi:MAG: LemA family protein [Candidatus Hydrogenedentes bacterium]|nr:LemA family protein [Candidatus Hydrogenedentota bacterium]